MGKRVLMVVGFYFPQETVWLTRLRVTWCGTRSEEQRMNYNSMTDCGGTRVLADETVMAGAEVDGNGRNVMGQAGTGDVDR
jgi:hypothetical protein